MPFPKQYNWKPRSDSQSSDKSFASIDSDKSESVTTNSNNSNLGNQRRASASGAFAGLTQLKREIRDEDAAARKASFMEQKPGTMNPIAKMWHNFTQGPSGAS